MKFAIPVIAAAVLSASSASWCRADEAFAPSDPRFVVQTVIELTDQHALPGWDAGDFGAKLAPYLTSDFLRR